MNVEPSLLGGVAFRILGPVQVFVDGRFAPLGQQKLAALLVTLLSQPNAPISIDRIVGVLWDHEPPASAVPNVRTHVHRLRAALGEHGERITALASSYRLTVENSECDFAVFRDLVDQARGAMANGDAGAAALLLERGLMLWSGDIAATGLLRHGFLDGWLNSFDEDHQRAHEDLCEARIVLGDARSALPRLRTLLAVAPLRSRAWALAIRGYADLREVDAVFRCMQLASEVFQRELAINPPHDVTIAFREAISRTSPPR